MCLPYLKATEYIVPIVHCTTQGVGTSAIDYNVNVLSTSLDLYVNYTSYPTTGSCPDGDRGSNATARWLYFKLKFTLGF